MSDHVLRFDHVQEFNDWKKLIREKAKAESASIMSYVQRFEILELCGGNLALVHDAIKLLSRLLRDQAFRAEAQVGANALTALYPLGQPKPWIQELRLELWADPDPRLAAALASDGFRCVAGPDCRPQVYYGSGELARYKRLLLQPGTVSPYDAGGAVQGRAMTKDADGAAGGAAAVVEALGNLETSGSALVRKTELRAAIHAAAAHTAKAREHQSGAEYEAPPPGALLPNLVASDHCTPLLIAIIRREGSPDLKKILEHLRGSFNLARIAGATQDRVHDRLVAMCKDGVIGIDDQGHYFVPSHPPRQPTGAPPADRQSTQETGEDRQAQRLAASDNDLPASEPVDDGQP